MRRCFPLLVFLLLAACAPKSLPTQAANPGVTAVKSHPLDTRTGIEGIDAVLAAVQSNRPQELHDMIHFTKTTCRTVQALGGPPSCRAGEAEGTPVEVLPMLGPEGNFLRKDEIDNLGALDVIGLYAVYQVSDQVRSEEYYPAGEYGVILIGAQGSPSRVLQIRDGGIVRLDNLFGVSPAALANVLSREASNLILAPQE